MRWMLGLLLAVAVHLCQARAMAQANMDAFVVELERLQPAEPLAPMIRTLLDAVREQGKLVGSKGRLGAWAIDCAEQRLRQQVDPHPRGLSPAASHALLGALGDAYTTLYRSAALIPLGDDADKVFATVGLVADRFEAGIVGTTRFHQEAKRNLRVVAEQIIVGIPGSPPWAASDDSSALKKLVEDACVDVERIGAQPRQQGMDSQQDFSARFQLFNESMARFREGLVALRGERWHGGIPQVVADPLAWKSVSRGYPDSMEQVMLAARESFRNGVNGMRELSGAEIPGLPPREALEWAARSADAQIRRSAALLGAMIAGSAHAAKRLAVGESQDVDFVWSASAAAIMACRGSIARGKDGCAMVFGPLTSVSYEAADEANPKPFGPLAVDVLAGAIISWSLEGTQPAIDAPVTAKDSARFWDGGGRWGWMGGAFDPSPSWITDRERMAPIIAASAKAGLGELGSRIAAVRANFRLHYDFSRSGYQKIGAFDRDAAVELFVDPRVALIEPTVDALASLAIGDGIRLDVVPRGERTRCGETKSARDICASAPDRIAMRRIVEIDADTVDAAAIAAQSAEALRAGDRLYAFLLDEAAYRASCRAQDEPAKGRVLERLCRQLGLPFDHPFRVFVDKRLGAASPPGYEGVTRAESWLRLVPVELRHPRLQAGKIGNTQETSVP